MLDLTQADFVERELLMVKIGANTAQRSEILEIASIFRANVVDLSGDAMVVEVTGSADKAEAFVDMVRPFGIQELVRTGRIAIGRTRR